MYIRTSELILKLIVALGIVYLFCAILQHFVFEHDIKVIGSINGYELIEMEDGHQYLRRYVLYNQYITPYPECPKCNK